MARLAAFVGHSFAKQDENVVRQFLDFFSHISDLGIGFTWDHAEYAEPKELSAKVLQKIEGKNVFIGICTAKERVTAPDKLRPALFRPHLVVGRLEDYELKTSDWVIQEIGLAKGRSMEIILLLEQGVREPGGLQGDLEYVPFNRQQPAEAFTKVLEMLKSLTPRAQPSESVSPPDARDTTAGAIDAVKENDVEGSPTSAWSQEQFDRALTLAILNEDEGREKNVHEVYALSPLGQDPRRRAVLEAYGLHMRNQFGRSAETSRLSALADRYPEEEGIQRYLANSLMHYKLFGKAAEHYEKAAALSHDAALKAGNLADAAMAMHKAGNPSAESWLRARFSENRGDGDAVAQIVLGGLQALVADEDRDQWIGYAEARIALEPDNQGLRFDLAYKYSANRNHALALYHYLLIPTQERRAAVWNNIGAAQRALGLSSFSVAAYRKSAGLGGARAAGNLASHLVEAGFLEEAKEVCAQAIANNHNDERLAGAMLEIAKKREQEDGEQKKILADADREHRFMADLGNACALPMVELPARKWKTPECELTVRIEGGQFTATGQYHKEEGGLRVLFNPGAVPTKKSYSVSYTGRVVGHGAFFSKTVQEDGGPIAMPTLLGGPTPQQGYLIVDAKTQAIRTLARPEKESAKVEDWLPL